MSSLLANLPEFTVTNLFHLLIIFGVALILSRSLHLIARFVVKPSAASSRTAEAREQQKQEFSESLQRVGRRLIWAGAFLTAAQEIGINVIPLAIVSGFAILAVGFGAQQLVRDVLAGVHIVLEDQFMVGDSIQAGDILGRVELFTLRHTVVRDSRGAVVTIANGELRAVGNLSRDWSQAFVDVAVSPLLPQESSLQLLDAVATELRNDSVWSPALLDGPRVLGLQSYDQNASIIRLQVRTAPSRQEDVARELRRRIQLEFQRQGISLSSVQRIELVNPSVLQETAQRASTA